MLVAQLGESANTLVAQWQKQHRGYRYGFPDFYAAEFPVRPMNYDQSRIYAGVIGRHYPNAETRRYHSLYDPNMYLQPGAPAGFGNVEDDNAIAVFEGFLSLTPANTFGNFDVVFDTLTATGVGIDTDRQLAIIHGGTLQALQVAVAQAGGRIVTQTPDAGLAARIKSARTLEPTIRDSTLGKLSDVRAAVDNMIAVLKAGTNRPVAVTNVLPPTAAAAALPAFSKTTKIAIAGATAVVAIGALSAFLLSRR